MLQSIEALPTAECYPSKDFCSIIFALFIDYDLKILHLE